MEKLAELVGSRGAEPRGQIQHFEPRHPAGKPAVERVGGTAVYARLPCPVAGADDHVVALVHLRLYGVDASRVVLAVGLHEYEDLPAGGPGTTLDRRAIAHRIAARPHPGPARGSDHGRDVHSATVPAEH